MRPLQNGNLRLLASYMEIQVPRGSDPVKRIETAWPFISPGRHTASLLLYSICQSSYTNLYRFKGRDIDLSLYGKSATKFLAIFKTTSP